MSEDYIQFLAMFLSDIYKIIEPLLNNVLWTVDPPNKSFLIRLQYKIKQTTTVSKLLLLHISPLYLFMESNSYNTVVTPKGVFLSLSLSTLTNLASYCRQHTIHPLNTGEEGGVEINISADEW